MTNVTIKGLKAARFFKANKETTAAAVVFRLL